MWWDSQGSIPGQVCFAPPVSDQRVAERVYVINLQAACATDSLSLHGA